MLLINIMEGEKGDKRWLITRKIVKKYEIVSNDILGGCPLVERKKW